MLKKFLVVIAVLSLSFTTLAQNIEGVNARLDGIAGSAPSDDIGWTIKHPASICDWPNQVQSSICLMNIAGIGKTYGAIIGIVQLNEVLYAGVTLNNRTMLAGNFYEEAALFLNQPHITGADNAKDFPNIPYPNVGFKFSDNFKLGLGGYFEAAHYDYDATKKIAYATSSGSDTIFYNEIHDKKRIRNHGGIIEAKIKLGPLTIYPQITVGLPQIKGTESYNILDKAKEQYKKSNASAAQSYSNTNVTYEATKKLYLRGASYFWTDIGNTFFITGLIYEKFNSQFKYSTEVNTGQVDVNGSIIGNTSKTVTDSVRPERDENWIHFFLGFVPSFSDNLYFAPEYDGGLGWYKAQDPDDTVGTVPPDTTFYYTYHNFRLGIEKYIEDFWWFDKLGLRCGIVAYWNREWRHVDNFDDETSVSDEALPWKSYFWGSDITLKEAKVTGGFGVTKGRGTFDISCDFLKWQGQGVLVGPAAAMATMTVDFSRKKEF